MKLRETLLNTKKTKGDKDISSLLEHLEEVGNGHNSESIDTPMLKDAFKLSEEEKIVAIAEKFGDIMDILGLDRSDDSLKGTPLRVAKMYVQEVFQGLDPKNRPEPKLFKNNFRYNQMLVEKNITVHSYCEHHFVPIIGKAHVAYISNGNVIGLSKINRVVRYFSKRPQVQERLTEQIAAQLKSDLNTEDVAVYIEADHFCVATRGVEDSSSSTITTHFGGCFEDDLKKNEFLKYVG